MVVELPDKQTSVADCVEMHMHLAGRPVSLSAAPDGYSLERFHPVSPQTFGTSEP
jgi:hypothetical protein